MASKNHFNSAMRKWERLHEEQAFSVPVDQSRTILLTPYDPSKVSPVVTLERLKAQTLQLADHLLHENPSHGVDVALDATSIDFERTYTDPRYARVIILGRGSIGSVETRDKLITWREIGTIADHLKTGTTHQLFCGGTPAHLNVPLGIFGASDHRNVLVPTKGRRYIPNKENARVTLTRLNPASSNNQVTKEYVQEHYPTGVDFSFADHAHLLIDRLETHARNRELLKRTRAYILAKCITPVDATE